MSKADINTILLRLDEFEKKIDMKIDKKFDEKFDEKFKIYLEQFKEFKEEVRKDIKSLEEVLKESSRYLHTRVDLAEDNIKEIKKSFSVRVKDIDNSLDVVGNYIVGRKTSYKSRNTS